MQEEFVADAGGDVGSAVLEDLDVHLIAEGLGEVAGVVAGGAAAGGGDGHAFAGPAAAGDLIQAQPEFGGALVPDQNAQRTCWGAKGFDAGVVGEGSDGGHRKRGRGQTKRAARVGAARGGLRGDSGGDTLPVGAV